jgi:hypothetical protein
LLLLLPLPLPLPLPSCEASLLPKIFLHGGLLSGCSKPLALSVCGRNSKRGSRSQAFEEGVVGPAARIVRILLPQQQLRTVDIPMLMSS